MSQTICIIDYGMGNIHSVQKALQHCGAQTRVTNDPGEIASSAKAVLPGVGAFADAMRELEKQGLVPVILAHLKDNKPFLGICLGMQLLFEQSEESKGTRGLGVFRGKVRRFSDQQRLKVPHMGWNQVRQRLPHPLWEDIPGGERFYFVHSYYVAPADDTNIAGSTDYGIDFTSAVAHENLFAVQFHPEKSQRPGLALLRNFLHWQP